MIEMAYEDRYGFFPPYVKWVIYRYFDCGILKKAALRGYAAVIVALNL